MHAFGEWLIIKASNSVWRFGIKFMMGFDSFNSPGGEDA
jgi:hypothetical protein